MTTIVRKFFANDVTKLPKVTLAEICTDLNIDSVGSALELSQKIWEYIQEKKGSGSVLDKSKEKLLAGQTSITWFRFDDLKDAKSLI